MVVIFCVPFFLQGKGGGGGRMEGTFVCFLVSL